MPIEGAMAVPRPVLIAIIGIGVLLSALLATRNAGQGGEASVTPASPADKPALSATPKPKETTPVRTDQGESGAKQAEKPQPAPSKAEPSPAPAKPAPADSAPKILPMARALESDKVVLLLISRPGAADDTAARLAVRAIERERLGRVAVFTDGVKNLPVYQPLLANIQVSQLPSIVIVRPGRRARLLEGYVDKASLRQHVTDALR
jgi:hypothetical protein